MGPQTLEGVVDALHSPALAQVCRVSDLNLRPLQFCQSCRILSRAATLLVCFPSGPHTNSQVHIQAHKPDQTKININGLDMAKSAAQQLYFPVLVYK